MVNWSDVCWNWINKWWNWMLCDELGWFGVNFRWIEVNLDEIVWIGRKKGCDLGSLAGDNCNFPAPIYQGRPLLAILGAQFRGYCWTCSNSVYRISTRCLEALKHTVYPIFVCFPDPFFSLAAKPPLQYPPATQRWPRCDRWSSC